MSFEWAATSHNNDSICFNKNDMQSTIMVDVGRNEIKWNDEQNRFSKKKHNGNYSSFKFVNKKNAGNKNKDGWH